jgi:hypothetical protein
MRGNRKDANQTLIEQALKRAGASVIDCTVAPSLGFDLLVAKGGSLHVVEVKDGNAPLSKRKLTPGEAARKDELEYKGIKYNIVENVEQALKLIGAGK